MVTGIGGLTFNFGAIQITSIATALIIGILTNLLVKEKKAVAPVVEETVVEEAVVETVEE